MSTKFVTNIDLNQNQVENAKFEALASNPGSSNFAGRLIYNTTEGTIQYYHGAAFRKLLRAITSSTTALTASEANGSVALTVAVADGSDPGLQSSAHYTQATNATNANTASTVVKRDGSGNFSAGTITATLTGNVTGNVTGTTSDISNHDTGDLTEGSNLYYTDARVRANRLDQMAVPTAAVSVNSQKKIGRAHV